MQFSVLWKEIVSKTQRSDFDLSYKSLPSSLLVVTLWLLV